MSKAQPCPACGNPAGNRTHCPTCDGPREPDPARMSEADDSLFEQQVEEASVPNLADLFRKAKKSGAIADGTGKEYGESS